MGRPRREGTSLEVSSRLARTQFRQKLGTLRSKLVRPQTLRVYNASLRWFFMLLREAHIEFATALPDLDDLVCDAIELAWSSGLGRNLCGNLLSGLEHWINSLRGNLRGSWRLWRVWGENEVPCRAPPLNARGVLALCYYMWNWRYPGAALVTLVAFSTFLRTMEFISMKAGQLCFNATNTRLHIQLPSTKGASRRGGMEGVTVEDPLIIAAVCKFSSSAQPGDLLMGLTCGQYRVLFNAACEACGLDSSFKPYSLRRGGASHHFRRFGNMSLTMDIGRWAELRTAKTYINTALLELTSMNCLENDIIASAAESFIAILARYAE